MHCNSNVKYNRLMPDRSCIYIIVFLDIIYYAIYIQTKKISFPISSQALFRHRKIRNTLFFKNINF